MERVNISYPDYVRLTSNLPNIQTYAGDILEIPYRYPDFEGSDRLTQSIIFLKSKNAKGDLYWRLTTTLDVVGKTCPLTGFVMDKRSGIVAYNDLTHRYWDTSTGEVFTSVTTLLSKYKTPFDTQLMASYKAIQQLMGDKFKKFKGFMTPAEVVDFFNGLKKTADIELKYQEAISHFIALWAEKNLIATTKGTQVHNQREYILLKETNDLFYKTFYWLKSSIPDAYTPKLLLEFLLFSTEYKIAGQVDKILVNDNKFVIIDYKTNASIDKTNKFQKMRSILSHLDDCSYNHYALQLSLYAYLYKQTYPDAELEGLYLEHIQEYDSTYIEVPYLEREIINILGDLKCA